MYLTTCENWPTSPKGLTVTDGLRKLVTIHRDGTVYTALFDLEADPHELRDLAAHPTYSEVRQELQAAALAALLDTTLP
ncbi:hypothetical protein ACWDWO_09640 [Actinopolymorpha singaporensis]